MSSENVTFTEITDVLNNPYMGWSPWAEWGPYSQSHRLVYAQIPWLELEPTKGNFNWSGVETRLQFDYWTSKNIKIILRIVMDDPGNSSKRDIPDWLYSEINNEGTWYSSGFSPNYRNAALISNHERMITALGQRYNNDLRIAFIEFGSLGHWGEFHTVYLTSTDQGYFPEISISDQYIKHYLNAFPNKIFLIRRPFQIAKDNNIGLYNDMFGNVDETQTFIRYFTSGYTNSGTWGFAAGTYPAMPDFWKSAPSGGEFGDSPGLQYLADSTIQQSIQLAATCHTSWLGPCCPASQPAGSTLQKNINSLLSNMGYRFVLQSESHAPSINSGSTLNVTMQWNNKGVAPFYFKWPLELSLADSSNNVVVKANTNEDVRTWLPGLKTVTQGLNIPQNLTAGTYTLCVAIIDPETKAPGINFAIAGKRSDGRYPLGQLTVNNSTPVNPPVISSVAVGSITSTSAVITWSTDKTSSSQVEYGTTTAYGTSSALTPDLVTAHSITITGLVPSTIYNYRVKSSDAQGNLTLSSNYSFSTPSVPVNPPVISSVAAGSIASNSAVITWSTDKTSSSQVEYGTTTAYGTSSPLASDLVTAHSITITGLVPSTTYNYRVKSSDAQGNLSVSSNYSFITLSSPVPPSSIIIDGSTSDWNGINTLISPAQSVASLKVANDTSKLYICIVGNGLNMKGQIFINTDNKGSTGYNDSVWNSTGCEYLLENDTLYKYTGNGSSWSWSKIGVMSFARNDTVIEVSIPLSSMGLGSSSTITLGYILNNSNDLRLPGPGQKLTSYTCK